MERFSEYLLFFRFFSDLLMSSRTKKFCFSVCLKAIGNSTLFREVLSRRSPLRFIRIFVSLIPTTSPLYQLLLITRRRTDSQARKHFLPVGSFFSPPRNQPLIVHSKTTKTTHLHKQSSQCRTHLITGRMPLEMISPRELSN